MDNSFSDLKNLKKLTLELSDINLLSQDFFDGLSNLKTLNLNPLDISSDYNISDNELGNSRTKVIVEGLANIRILHLYVKQSRNKMQFNLFSKLTNLKNIKFLNTDFTSWPSFENNKQLSTFKWYSNSNGVNITLPNLANLPLMSDVIIEFTNLVTLSANIFFNSTNILNVSLSNNNLTSLPRNVFSHQRKVMRLNLSHNLLSEIDENCFSNLTWLHALWLSHNRISYISRYGLCTATRSYRLLNS